MTFLYPSFLYALAAVSIPVIIHLYNFRRFKTVYFSNVQFLKNVKEDTKSKSQLKHLLILLLRILAISAIVMAFARPFVPAAKESSATAVKKGDIVSVYVDNSFSMEAESKQGKLIEIAKNRAREITDAYSTNAKFLLITNDFEHKHSHFVNKEQFSEFLSDIQTSSLVKTTGQILSRTVNIIENSFSDEEQKNIKKTVYIISDFQKSTTQLNQATDIDSTLKVVLLPVSSQTENNLYIDSIWFESPARKLNQNEELYVNITNISDQEYESIPLRLSLNDSLKAIGSIDIDGNTTKTATLNFVNRQTGILNGKVELTDYPITFDNTFYFSFQITEQINVLEIYQEKESQYLKALFNEDDHIKLTSNRENSVVPSQFVESSVVILNSVKTLSSGLAQEIRKFVKSGGSLIFLPHIEGDKESYNELLMALNSGYFTNLDTQRTKISNVRFKSELFSGVFREEQRNLDLPVINQHFKFESKPGAKTEPLLVSDFGHEVLSLNRYDRGKVYVFTFSLDTEISNFVKHPIFVPAFYNMALYSQPFKPLYHIIGKDNTVLVRNPANMENNIFKVRKIQSDYEFIPGQLPDISSSAMKLDLMGNIKEAAHYQIINNEQIIDAISFNYDRSESILTYFNSDELESEIQKQGLNNFSLLQSTDDFLVNSIMRMEQGTQYWKLFILLALLFFVGEALLIRLWR